MHRKGTFPHKDVPLRSGEVAVSPYSIETEKLSKMRKQEFVSNEEQGKTANETEINNLSDTEFKSFVIRMLIELGKRIEERSEIFNNEVENFF